MRNLEYKSAETPYFLDFDILEDYRGILASFEFSKFPFPIARFFSISVSSVEFSRGSHAHKYCWQAFFSILGSQKIYIKNIYENRTFDLADQKILVVPPFNWCKIDFSSSESKMGVFASLPFSTEDYIYNEPLIQD